MTNKKTFINANCYKSECVCVDPIIWTELRIKSYFFVFMNSNTLSKQGVIEAYHLHGLPFSFHGYTLTHAQTNSVRNASCNRNTCTPWSQNWSHLYLYISYYPCFLDLGCNIIQISVCSNVATATIKTPWQTKSALTTGSSADESQC